MKNVLVIFAFISCTAFTFAQTPPPDDPKPTPVKPRIVPSTITAKAGELIKVTAALDKGEVSFIVPELLFDPAHAQVDGKVLWMTIPANATAFRTKGTITFKVAVSYIDAAGKIATDQTTVTVTGGTPGPAPPDPVPTDPLEKLAFDFAAHVKSMDDYVKRQHDFNVLIDARLKALEGPRPPPVPPDPPKPPTPPAPIPLAGFRVLIVYDPTTLTPAQQGITSGKKVRDYLQSHCVVGADGKTKDFWILQTGVDVSAGPKWIGDVIQKHPGQRTFMVVSDGKTGFDGPLPASADEALQILTKIGGP